MRLCNYCVRQSDYKCVFNTVWETMELNGTEETAVSGLGYTHSTCWRDQLIVGFRVFI